MTYETKAEIFTRTLAATGSVVEALREADRMASMGRRGGLTEEQIDALRSERADGATLATLADHYGYTQSYMSMLCTGIKPAPKPASQRRPACQLAAPLVAEIGSLLELREGWERFQPRGRRPRPIALGQKVLVLALAAGRATNVQIADVLGHKPWRVVRKIADAEGDARARDLAQAVLAAVQADDVSAFVPAPLPAPSGVAA